MLSLWLVAQLTVNAAVLPTDKLAWDQFEPSVTNAQGNLYRAYLDEADANKKAVVTLTGVVCSGAASPFTCVAPLPALTTGSHTISLTADLATGGAETVHSNQITVVLALVPGTPGGLRTVKQ